MGSVIIERILNKFNFTGMYNVLVAMGKTLQTDSGVSYHPDVDELRVQARTLLEGAMFAVSANKGQINTFTAVDQRLCLKASLHRLSGQLELQFIPFETAQNINQKN